MVLALWGCARTHLTDETVIEPDHGTSGFPEVPDTDAVSEETGDTGPSTGTETADTGISCVIGDTVVSVVPPHVRRLVGSIDIDAAFDARIDGSGAKRNLGGGVSRVPGDVNGDGVMDIGASFGSTIYEGVTVFLGPIDTGTFAEDEVGDAVIWNIATYDPYPQFLDVDLDGRSELAGRPVPFGPIDEIQVWSYPGSGVHDTADLVPVLTIPSVFEPATFAYVSDIDGDGVGDLWVGEPGGDIATDESVVRLYLGPLVGELEPSNAVAQYTQTGDLELGLALDLGDLDGSGVLDLVIGGYLGPLTTFEGRVFLVSDPAQVVADIHDVVTTTFESPPGDVDGGDAVMVAGDVDADGFDDVAFGQIGSGLGAHDAGALFLQYGPPPQGVFPPSCAPTIVESPPPDGNVALIVAGDFDDDGYSDVVASRESVISDVQYHTFYGPIPTGILQMADADAIFGEFDVSQGMGSVGDVSGDGVDDLVFYDELANEGGGNGSGAIWLFFGGTL